MTSSSSIDSHFTPGRGGGGGGGGDAGGGGGGGSQHQSAPLQYQTQQNHLPPLPNHQHHHHPLQPSSFQHRHPVTTGSNLVTAGSMATPIVNGKLPGAAGMAAMPAPIPACTGNSGSGQATKTPTVRTISRHRATMGRDGADGKGTTSLPSRVSQLYYKHGLFLSTYPTCATSIAVALIIFCW